MERGTDIDTGTDTDTDSNSILVIEQPEVPAWR